MSLNSGALNSFALNGAPSTGTSSTGGGVVASIQQIVNATGSTNINVAQIVGKLSTAGANASIVQAVELLYTSTPGAVVTMVQKVKALGTKTLDVEQVVAAVSEPTTFFGRNGYEPMLYMGGARVDADNIIGMINVTFSEDNAPQLKFKLKPDSGVQDVRQYRGQSVSLRIREASGITQIYTGKVNTPVVRLIEQDISFSCSLDIEQVVNDDVPQADINAIGFYNNEVFSKPKTKYQELKDRVSTIPSSINVTPAGTISVQSISAAASPTYTLADSSVYRDNISFNFSSGQRHVNKVNIKVNYDYQRLHHHERAFAATVPYAFSVCRMLIDSYVQIPRALISGAVEGSAWPLKNTITYTPTFPSGNYQCWLGHSLQGIMFSTAKTGGTVQDVVDADGNPVTIDGVTQQELVNHTFTDYGPTLCLGAEWTSTTRFSQNINNEYTLTVQAPQSQAIDGDKESEITLNMNSDFKDDDWSNYNSFSTDIPAGLSVTGTSNTNYWVDANTNQSTLNTSIDIMLNKAKSQILKSHRDDKVMFKRSLWTAITLADTVKLNCTRVVAQGKVSGYTHSINCSTGEAYTTAELSLSRSQGSATDSVLSAPTQPTSTPTYQTTKVTMEGHFGQNPATTVGSESWTGVIASGGPLQDPLDRFPTSFVFDTPAIDTNLRERNNAVATASFDVEIPDDTLTIDFTGKH